MKISKFCPAVLAIQFFPTFCFANMNGGLNISMGAIVLFFSTILLAFSNAIFCLVNVFSKKRGIRYYNIFATSLLFAGAVYLSTQELKAGLVAIFVLLIHVLFIRLSMVKKILVEDEQ